MAKEDWIVDNPLIRVKGISGPDWSGDFAVSRQPGGPVVSVRMNPITQPSLASTKEFSVVFECCELSNSYPNFGAVHQLQMRARRQQSQLGTYYGVNILPEGLGSRFRCQLLHRYNYQPEADVGIDYLYLPTPFNRWVRFMFRGHTLNSPFNAVLQLLWWDPSLGQWRPVVSYTGGSMPDRPAGLVAFTIT